MPPIAAVQQSIIRALVEEAGEAGEAKAAEAESPVVVRRRRGFHEDVVRSHIRYAFLNFAVQAGLSITAVAFSTAMIATHDDVEGIYLPIITAVLGFWLPSPAFASRRRTNDAAAASTDAQLIEDMV